MFLDFSKFWFFSCLASCLVLYVAGICSLVTSSKFNRVTLKCRLHILSHSPPKLCHYERSWGHRCCQEWPVDRGTRHAHLGLRRGVRNLGKLDRRLWPLSAWAFLSWIFITYREFIFFTLVKSSVTKVTMGKGNDGMMAKGMCEIFVGLFFIIVGCFFIFDLSISISMVVVGSQYL